MLTKVIEKRKLKRIKTELNTRYKILSEDIENEMPSVTSREIQAKTDSLSLNGALLRTNVVRSDGLHIALSNSGLCKNKLDIEFDLPTCSRTLHVVGEVSWYDLTSENDQFHYNVGVLFKELSKEDRDFLKKFIRKEEKHNLSFIRKWFSTINCFLLS